MKEGYSGRNWCCSSSDGNCEAMLTVGKLVLMAMAVEVEAKTVREFLALKVYIGMNIMVEIVVVVRQ